MPLPFNWPGEASALAKMFGLKGKLPLGLDEIVVPVTVVGNLDDAPWSSSRPVGKERSQVAVALNNSGVMARPGRGVWLRIDGFVVDNEQAGVATFEVRLLTPANIAALTNNGDSNVNSFLGIIEASGTWDRTGSLVSSVQHTSTIGANVMRLRIPQDEHVHVHLDQPIYIDGDARGGIGALCVWCATQNQSCIVGFSGREYFNRS